MIAATAMGLEYPKELLALGNAADTPLDVEACVVES